MTEQYLPGFDDPRNVDPQTANALLHMSDVRMDEGISGQAGEIVEARQEALADIEAFAAPGTPVARLFERFQPGLAEEQHPGVRLKAYEAICVENFNFRQGPDGRPRERQEIDHILKMTREEVGEDLWDATFDAADEMGMHGNTELADGAQVKCLGVLGGAPTAIANRTKYALEQVTGHQASVDSLDFLMAEREVDMALKEAERQLGLDVSKVVSQQELPEGLVTTYEPVELDGRMVPVRVLTGKAQPGRDRATTLDTMNLWRAASDVQSGDQMVAVTTDLYTDFQRNNSLEVITWDTGAKIDVIGHSAEWAGNTRFANQLLQELKAGVDSRDRLYDKMVEAGMAELSRSVEG